MTSKKKSPAPSDERNGCFLDGTLCCKVCDGEIPYGHTEECDIWKQERENERLRATLAQYGDHTARCDKRHESKPCSCGWDALSGDLSASILIPTDPDSPATTYGSPVETAAPHPDTARLDYMERWLKDGKRRGFTWDTFAFQVDEGIRPTIDRFRGASAVETNKDGRCRYWLSGEHKFEENLSTTCRCGAVNGGTDV